MSGGTQQWVIGLAHALSQLDDGADEYIFLASPGSDDWLRQYVTGRCRIVVADPGPPGTPPGAKVGRRRLRKRLANRLPALRDALCRRRRPGVPPTVSPERRLIDAERADVMHFTTQSGFITTVPSVYQPWDLQHLHLPQFFTPEQVRWREARYRAFCAQARQVVVPTSWVKRDLVAQYGLRAERITVVNPPPVTWAYARVTATQEAEEVERLGLPDRFVFYPAFTWAHKNHERLFEALAALRRRGIDVPLVCSGGVTDRDEAVTAMAERLGIASLVRFVGFVTTTQMQVLYRRATALVFPSLYEGWGLPIVEAFAADLAVATSTATSLPELVGDAALTFDPYDPSQIAAAIELLWRDDSVRAEYVRRGRARVAAFSWERTAVLMRALYRQVAGIRLAPEDRDLLAAPPAV